MKTILEFDNEETKVLLSKLDFEYYLKLNVEKENYQLSDIDLVYESYRKTLRMIKLKLNKNKKQYNYYLDGQVRKMFLGGFLPAHFELDETKHHILYDFSEIGKDWAFFEFWQNYQKKLIKRKRIWNIIIKSGSILAIILTIIKLFEILTIK